ncbi:YidB family protein [Ramlibacter sp. XY19]|uniref:YidB family protein n=1 Tax=Ramlibacter paludis TaxID=2908000 RepID=UPI0023DA76A0|nr:YidB family protein [Ramlibacter paludis]MCG2594094.1 YidB family protein [Ramlibacter paludis]
MTRNPLLGQVLGGVFGRALARRGGGAMGGMGGGLGGAVLGSVLGGAMARRGGSVAAGRSLGGNRSALLMMLLPLAMRWVQNTGGLGAVLKRVQQKGYGQQARSWLEPGDNQPLDEQAVQQIVGDADIQQMADRLGVPREQVAQAFAEIMPEMVDQLTPQGDVSPHVDEVLDEGRATLEKEIEDVQFRESATPH